MLGSRPFQSGCLGNHLLSSRVVPVNSSLSSRMTFQAVPHLEQVVENQAPLNEGRPLPLYQRSN